jgi:hypothetical protein
MAGLVPAVHAETPRHWENMLGRVWAVVAWMAGTSPARTRKDESH